MNDTDIEQTSVEEITDSSLELKIEKKTLGELVTNAQEIRDLVKSSLVKYDASNYNDDNINQAKKDKALLNSAAKTLNDKRIKLETEFTAPFSEFKCICNETIGLMKDCSSRIDGVVKANEQAYKDQKKIDVETLFAKSVSNENDIPLNKIWDDRWLNKSVTMHKVEEEIQGKINDINTNIEYLRNLSESDFDILKSQYMVSLNLNNALDFYARLKADREKKQRLEAERKSREQQIIPPVEAKPQTVSAGFNFVQQPPKEKEQEQPIKGSDDMLERTFSIKATRKHIIELSDWLNDNLEDGEDFDKVEIEDTLCKSDCKNLILLLEYAREYIEKSSTGTVEQNKARLIGNMVKKLKSKF